MGLCEAKFLPEPLVKYSQEVEGLSTLSQIKKYYGKEYGVAFVDNELIPQFILEEYFLIDAYAILKKYDCYKLTWIKNNKIICAYLWNSLIIRIFK